MMWLPLSSQQVDCCTIDGPSTNGPSSTYNYAAVTPTATKSIADDAVFGGWSTIAQIETK